MIELLNRLIRLPYRGFNATHSTLLNCAYCIKLKYRLKLQGPIEPCRTCLKIKTAKSFTRFAKNSSLGDPRKTKGCEGRRRTEMHKNVHLRQHIHPIKMHSLVPVKFELF